MKRIVLALLVAGTAAGLATPADAFWVARGWRGGVVAGGGVPFAARAALLAHCWRCAPAAALAGGAVVGAAVVGTAPAPTPAAATATALPAKAANTQVAQAGGAGSGAAAHCASSLPADSKIIYDASIRNMKSLETLRDTVVAQTRSLVEAGKISEADARPAAEKAGTCLRMLATP
ncbi:hypothetical protein [Methylobacterium soli]|uniref:Uncharacterized protein n=1 Tax=Methylobacterium soli TaxID=553447 RepID=A0A6L3T2Z7_9HYPH|nr:hypothetical protein [Methylobacterium soli]KAB1081175.1 hypothetical protein F6X53_02365 [Methylobacterium soli]GJE45791.1 hypothetical protein AEGHOMDF_4991 [Methylobacterium soli]